LSIISTQMARRGRQTVEYEEPNKDVEIHWSSWNFVFCLRSECFAQGEQKQPAKPIRPFVVTRAQSVSDLQKKLQGANKAEDLIGGPGLELRVAVQHEKDMTAANAEVHDASDDVYYVLEGTAT
jgi:hypothetical protein